MLIIHNTKSNVNNIESLKLSGSIKYHCKCYWVLNISAIPNFCESDYSSAIISPQSWGLEVRLITSDTMLLAWAIASSSLISSFPNSRITLFLIFSEPEEEN